MNWEVDLELATADGHDRHVPSDSHDILSAGHEGVYKWAADNFVHSGTRFLDVGCGTGYGSMFVTAASGTFDGIDSSAAAVRYARENYSGPEVRFFAADLMGTLPEALVPASYDVVFSSEVLEHVTDPFALVKVMAGLLRDDGVCLVGTPNRLWSRDHMPGSALLARSHVMEFTPPALEALLRTTFDEVALQFRMLPAAAIDSISVPANRPALMRAAIAFAREVAPVQLRRYGNVVSRRKTSRSWAPEDIEWLEPQDRRCDAGRCVGLVAICRGSRR